MMASRAAATQTPALCAEHPWPVLSPAVLLSSLCTAAPCAVAAKQAQAVRAKLHLPARKRSGCAATSMRRHALGGVAAAQSSAALHVVVNGLELAAPVCAVEKLPQIEPVVVWRVALRV